MTVGTVAAVDLGASNGRVVLGQVGNGKVKVRMIDRFRNDPLHTSTGLRWNLPDLYGRAIAGLRSALPEEPEVANIGVDSWACDYGLLRILADGSSARRADQRLHDGAR